jgi:hypothetical protein
MTIVSYKELKSLYIQASELSLTRENVMAATKEWKEVIGIIFARVPDGDDVKVNKKLSAQTIESLRGYGYKVCECNDGSTDITWNISYK